MLAMPFEYANEQILQSNQAGLTVKFVELRI